MARSPLQTRGFRQSRRGKIRAAASPRMGIRPPEQYHNELKEFEMTRTATDQSLGELEIVHLFHGAMPTGVSVSHTGRIFINFPRWGDDVEFTVAEIRGGKLIAYPSQAFNNCRGASDPEALVSVQSIVVDPADRL